MAREPPCRPGTATRGLAFRKQACAASSAGAHTQDYSGKDTDQRRPIHTRSSCRLSLFKELKIMDGSGRNHAAFPEIDSWLAHGKNEWLCPWE